MVAGMSNTTADSMTLIGYTDAAARWGVSTRTIARLVSSGELRAYIKPTDRRIRLVDAEEVEKALGPAPQD